MKIEHINIDINPEDVLDNMTPPEIMAYMKKNHMRWMKQQEPIITPIEFYKIGQWFTVANSIDIHSLVAFSGDAILITFNRKTGDTNRWNDTPMKTFDFNKVSFEEFKKKTDKPIGFFQPVDYKDIP